MKYFAVYIAAVWLLSVIVTLHDKRVSKIYGRRRVPEKWLMGLALLGGAVPMYITMKKIRHKTKHGKFMIGLPLVIIAELALLAYVIYRQTA